MGKRSKQGSQLRAKKRAKIADQQLQQALTDHGEQTRVQSKKDDELFVLDTQRKETAATLKAAAVRRNNAAEKKKEAESKKKQKYEYSDREKRKIQKVLNTHGKEEIIARAEKGRARLDQKKIRKQISAVVTKPTFDLWDEPTVDKKRKSRNVAKPPVVDLDPTFDPPTQPEGKQSKKQIKSRKVAQANARPQLAVEVAHPGQSYHPDKEHHQDAIGEALSIEIRRNEAVDYKKRPISEGMSAFTKGFIVNSDSEEEDSSDDEEDDTNTAKSTTMVKRKEKLTRAQRNKQKRVKAEQTALKERKTRKQFMHQVTESHIHNKAVKRAERENAERQAELEKMRAEKRAQPLGKNLWGKLSEKDAIRAPSLPVALTAELKKGEGGLRTVTPKGSLVTDRLESMVARNMITKKRQGGRRIVQGKKRPKRRGAQGTEYLLV